MTVAYCKRQRLQRVIDIAPYRLSHSEYKQKIHRITHDLLNHTDYNYTGHLREAEVHNGQVK